MEAKYGKKKSCIIWNVIALIFCVLVIGGPHIYCRDNNLPMAIMLPVSMVVVIGFAWLVYNLLTLEVKSLIVKCTNSSIVWVLAFVYLAILFLGIWWSYRIEHSVIIILYENVALILTTLLYPMLISALMEIRKRFDNSKIVTVHIMSAILLTTVCNWLVVRKFDFFEYLMVGIVQGFLIGAVISNLTTKCKKVIEVISAVGFVAIWIYAILLYHGGKEVRLLINNLWSLLTNEYNPFVANLTNRMIIETVIYFSIVAIFIVLMRKLLSLGNKKNRVFYISYRTAWIYLVVKYVIVLWMTLTENGLLYYSSADKYMLIDVLVVALLVFSCNDEYEMWKMQEEIRNKKVIGVKDVFGQQAGESFTLLKIYDDSLIGLIKDDKTGKVEAFSLNLLGYNYEDKNYDMISPLDNEDEILVFEYKSMEDISGDSLKESADKSVDEPDGEGYKFYPLEKELCEKVYQMYVDALLNRAADEYWHMEVNGEI